MGGGVWEGQTRTVAHSGKYCVYNNRMLSQNFRVYERKLAGCRGYLVYQGNHGFYNGAKPKSKMGFLGR